MTNRVVSAAGVFVFGPLFFLAAQAGYLPPNPITPPTVSPPAMAPMPTVAAPVVTGPSAVAPASTVNPATTATATATASSPASSTSAATSAASGKTASGTTASGSSATSSASTKSAASALSLLGLGSDNALLNALNGSDSESGSLDALSGLLGSSSASTDSATLNKILSLLEKHQAQNAASTAATASASSAASSTTAASAGLSASPEKARIVSGGELVRFTVNGYDVASSTMVLVSSILAKDGSFLLTGDRSYLLSNRTRTETFYLLCRKNADGSYRLHADVSQDSANEYSFLYRLARRSPLKGTLTGDLLVFRTTDPDFALDLVIRVINPTVTGASFR